MGSSSCLLFGYSISSSWLQDIHPFTKDRVEEVGDLQAMHGNPLIARITSKPSMLQDGHLALTFFTSLCVNSSITFIRVGLFIARMSVSTTQRPFSLVNSTSAWLASSRVLKSFLIWVLSVDNRITLWPGNPIDFAKSASWLVFDISSELKFVSVESILVQILRLFL